MQLEIPPCTKCLEEEYLEVESEVEKCYVDDIEEQAQEIKELKAQVEELEDFIENEELAWNQKEGED